MKRTREHQSSFKKQRYKYFIEPILESFKSVKKVRACIHKIEISSNLTGEEIRDRLGIDFNIYPIGNKPASQKGYLSQSHFMSKNLKVHLLTYPNFRSKNSILRNSFLTIVPKHNYSPLIHKGELLSLFSQIIEGDLKIKSAELTFDFFPNERFRVSTLFDSLVKTIYIKSITDPYDIDFNGYQFYKRRRLNRLIRIKDKNKIYERGTYNKRKSIKLEKNGNSEVVKCWLKKDLDRVRFERTLKRHELRDLNIVTPIDFINYKNDEKINILHKLIDYPEFKIISVGNHKFNYNCLMTTLTEMKRKHNYHYPVGRLDEIMLRRKMNRAILTHSNSWHSNTSN